MNAPVGCRAITTFDPVQRASVPAWVLYPARDGAREPARFGPFALDVAIDAAPAAAGLRAVVISHGSGGTPWSHRDLAVHLAREGFAVVMIEHAGNSRRDNSFGSPSGRVKAAMLQHRPRHVRLAFDAALGDPLVGPHLGPEGFAIVGYSIGASTALAAAGGHAMTVPDDVDDARLATPDADLARLAFAVATEPDPRVRAAVLLVPAIAFFRAEGALRDVAIPLLVRTAERDAICPAGAVAHALRSLPDAARVERADVPGAGHFSLQSPYPPELAGIPPAQDPPGFDRARYQPILHADVTAFLRSTAGW
jgi:predicted dienelactone hydrolase